MPRAFLIVALSLAAACATRQVQERPARPVAAVDASGEREAPVVDANGEREAPVVDANREGQPVQRVPSTPRGALRALDVEGFLPAVFFTPPGEAPARLVVTTHGAGGAPEWECEYWRQLTGDSAFVLSLRGKSMGGGIYSGYSQGASMGSAMLSRYGAAFPYLVLIEGFELWNIPRARAFAKSGGKRVLFACGTAQCSKIGEESVRWLQKAGLDARLEYVVGGGHTPAGQVMERVDAALPWLLGD